MATGGTYELPAVGHVRNHFRHTMKTPKIFLRKKVHNRAKAVPYKRKSMFLHKTVYEIQSGVQQQ